ncbi:hypothetical protein D3C87_1630840 [compost metagenome]
MFQQHDDRAGIFTRIGKTLDKAKGAQQQWCNKTGACIGWQETDRRGAQPHGHKRQEQQFLSSDAITVMAKNDRADRSGDERDRECGQGQQDRNTRIGRREKQRGKNQRRSRSEQVEVVSLEGRSKNTGKGDPSHDTFVEVDRRPTRRAGADVRHSSSLTELTVLVFVRL